MLPLLLYNRRQARTWRDKAGLSNLCIEGEGHDEGGFGKGGDGAHVAGKLPDWHTPGGLPLEVGYTSTTKPLEEEDNTIRTRASSHVIPALCACHSI